jgi:hypothetical protein
LTDLKQPLRADSESDAFPMTENQASFEDFGRLWFILSHLGIGVVKTKAEIDNAPKGWRFYKKSIIAGVVIGVLNIAAGVTRYLFDARTPCINVASYSVGALYPIVIAPLALAFFARMLRPATQDTPLAWRSVSFLDFTSDISPDVSTFDQLLRFAESARVRTLCKVHASVILGLSALVPTVCHQFS